jgi:hypothetical protein
VTDTLAALTTGPIDRPHYAASTSGSTDDGEWKRLMRDWYGLIPARSWFRLPSCPHPLVRKHCQRGTGICPWQPSRYRPLWDHCRYWRDPDSATVITLEPWCNPFDVTDIYFEMERTLDILGIVTCFEGRSPYGASFILFLMAADTDAGHRARWVSDVGRWRATP